MAAESVEETPDLKDMDEEILWDLINDNRHSICLGVRPCILIPYLRQVRVLTDLDEDEILTCLKFTNRSMRTSHMLDLLRVQGRNGAVALLDSLMIHYPNLYTQITGRKPSTEPSGFSGLIKYSELTEYLVRAVTGMQKELQNAREEATQLRARCSSLQGELSQAVTQGQESTRLQAEHARLRTTLAGTAADKRLLEVDGLAYLARDEAQVQIACSLAEKDTLRGQLVELQEKLFTLKAFSIQGEPDKTRVSTLICSILLFQPVLFHLKGNSIHSSTFFVKTFRLVFVSVSRTSPPLFLVRSRHQALRISGRALTFSFQGEALLSQLQVIGGNKTGVFVHQITKGSSAHTAGISPGAQILEVTFRALRMVLEDSTMEEALWALGQVQGPCSLSLRPKQDAYESLLQQLKKGEVTSGDSFYVRVNMSLVGGVDGALSVTCNDILHVTDTHHGQDGSWWASHVHSWQLMDLKSGSLPNYYRAQRLLIRAIEDMSFQQRTHRKVSYFPFQLLFWNINCNQSTFTHVQQ
uniref:CARD domain-containing protein n=1 Tax=Pygocentrus nattereri TaxID=42514 RepID=A0AAR2K165_PYGNA